MEIVDYLLARKKAGGGSDVTIEQLSVTENGTYSEQGIAYSPVVVNVPAPENSYQLTDIPAGTVSTIEDGTDLPMSSLKVGIEPVQDLHGYDHPWAGGAGKNLFDIDAEHTSGTGTYMYEVYVKPNTSYTLSTNCPYSSPASLYFNGGSTETNGVGNGIPRTFSSGEDGKFTIYVRNAASGPAINLYEAVKNGQYYIQLEEGSTATSYEPYSNICPISGWTAANVTRTGINAFDKTQAIENRYINDLNGNEELATGYKCTSFIRIKGGVQYYIKSDQTNARFGAFYDKNKQYISGLAGISYYNVPFSAPVNACYMRVTLCSDTSGDIDTACINISDAEINGQYYPYGASTTYTIQFTDGDNPLTVYGGTLDVTTGELVVDRAMITLDGTGRVIPAGTNRFNIDNLAIGYKMQVSYSSGICSMYKSIQQLSSDSLFDTYAAKYNAAYCFSSSWEGIRIKDTRYDTINDFTTMLASEKPTIVYELATPTTYHLTPTQVRTLVGNNNIWADTGDILSGKYFKGL